MHAWQYPFYVGKGGYHYDCGMELNPDGSYGRPEYMDRVNQGTFTLKSLYLLMWANFGSFCVALLTQPDSYQHLGPIFTDWQPLRNYCVSQLRTLWMFMQNNLVLTEEERCFFVQRAMTRFHEVCTIFIKEQFIVCAWLQRCRF